jgi:hypothetical protein
MRKVTFDRPIQTIKAISESARVNRITLAQVCQRGVLREDAYKSGDIWLIDTQGKYFLEWYTAHWQQIRVKGRLAREEEGNDAH